MKTRYNPNKKEINLTFIMEGRLLMPTVLRFLSTNNVKPSLNYIFSESFKEQYNTFSDYKKKDFLITMGGVKWKELQEKIES